MERIYDNNQTLLLLRKLLLIVFLAVGIGYAAIFALGIVDKSLSLTLQSIISNVAIYMFKITNPMFATLLNSIRYCG